MNPIVRNMSVIATVNEAPSHCNISTVMENVEILERALRLPPEERFVIVEGLLKSLDVPDPDLDRVWADEAERRLAAYRDGKLSAIPIEEVFRTR